MTECDKVIKKGIITRDFLKEEIICGYTVTTKLKKTWAIELDLLYEFKRVCDKYGLRWFACAGTLLGAVRHGGFIPWDDDLDVCMPREDYERLIKLYFCEFKTPYFLQTPYTDKEYCYSFAKLRNSNTSFAVEAFIESTMNQGIFLDIFPLDYSDIKEYLERRKKIVKTIEKCSAFMSRNNKYIKNKHTDKAKEIKFHSSDNIKLYEEIQNIAMSSNKESCAHYSTEIVTIYEPKRKLWPKRCFDNIVQMPFCNCTINVPEGWDELLQIMYGNYMSFPPVEQRGRWHDSQFLNPDLSYLVISEEYIKSLRETSILED